MTEEIGITRPVFGEEEIELLRECLGSGWVTQGPLTTRFEALVAAEHEARHALATTSCTAALHLAAVALELGPGDEVVVPAFTWVTSAHCAEYVGAKPVFVDVEESSFNLDCDLLEAAISDRTRAIVAVHLFGQSANMDRILEIARPRGIAVIEDAACAIGTRYHGRPVGGLGDVGCLSFHPRKVVTTGEGGMLLTQREELATALQSLRNHGATGLAPADARSPGPWSMATFDKVGYNLRLSDIQAAVGVVQMGRLRGLLDERLALARRYTQRLGELAELALPVEGADPCGHTYQSYVVRIREGGRARRNTVMRHLQEKAIQSRPGTHAVHRLGFYREKYGLEADDFPVASRCEDTSITLPLYPGMTEEEQGRVIEACRDGLRLNFTST